MSGPRRAFLICLAAAVVACGEQPLERSVPSPLSACLVTMDTTRRDALGAFGGRRGVTPNLDALAQESVCYDLARTVAPLTLPAHASMLTGLYPPRHGLRANGSAPSRGGDCACSE